MLNAMLVGLLMPISGQEEAMHDEIDDVSMTCWRGLWSAPADCGDAQSDHQHARKQCFAALLVARSSGEERIIISWQRFFPKSTWMWACLLLLATAQAQDGIATRV